MKRGVKEVFGGMITALSMYSIIPMPQREWKEENMKYAMCFLPLVGAVIGGAVYGWGRLCLHFGISPLLFAAVATLLPVIISGGIHLDGLIDTSDALYSRREREKKLEILSDPHVGAFGVIVCAGFLLLQFGLFGQLYESMELLPIVSISFVFSRSLSTLAVVGFKKAKKNGLVATFSGGAKSAAVIPVVMFLNVILTVLFCSVNFFCGVTAIAVGFVWLLLYKRLAYKTLGGVTGDLAGFFLQVCELLILLTAVVGGIVC